MGRLRFVLLAGLMGCSAVVRQEGENDDEPVTSGGIGPGVPVGDGGSGGYIEVNESECEDHPTPPLSAWQPNDPGPPDSPGALLVATQQAMVGDWHGVVTTPWVAPYEVLASFRADGSYSAHCVYNTDHDAGIDGCCRAFYYGSDRDSDLKHWELLDVTTSGAITGEIDIAFDYGNEFGLPGWQGELTHLEVDATADRLRFEFWQDGYGPVAFDLERVL